jgi:hypothetical protein
LSAADAGRTESAVQIKAAEIAAIVRIIVFLPFVLMRALGWAA